MLTLDQLNNLSRKFKIDSTLIWREYLQLIFLDALYGEKNGSELFFKGGTAIHLLLNSPRFSEDLDFSTTLPRKEIQKLVKSIERKIKKQIENLKIEKLHEGERSTRFKIKNVSSFFKYPLSIKLDFTENKINSPMKSPLVTEFPIIFFPLIAHLSPSEILAEKIRAILTRVKGRDFFDLWFLLAKKTPIDKELIQKKLKDVGLNFSFEELRKKIKSTPQEKISKDLAQFLPPNERKLIPNLKKFILNEIGFL